MPLFVFALTILFCPAFAEAGNTPRWALLSIALPAFLILFKSYLIGSRAPAVHWVGFIWLAWAAVSLFWSLSFYDGVVGLWRWVLFGIAFYLGSQLRVDAIGRIALAFACGLALNGVLALGQSEFKESLPWLDWILQTVSPAGTFVNKNYLAESALVGVVLALTLHLWWLRWPLAALCGLGWLLPLSRGAMLAGAVVALLWLLSRDRARKVTCRVVAGLIVVVAAGGFTWHYWGVDLDQSSFGDRVSFYANSLAMIGDKPFGHGIGNFWAAYPNYHDAAISTPADAYRFNSRPRTAHNDFLTLTTETGIIGGAGIIVLLFMVIYRSRSPYRYALFAILSLGAFNFPMYLPVTGFMAALVAGHLAAERSASGTGSLGSWFHFLRKHRAWRFILRPEPTRAE
tara:strand:+ start:1418 stop:2617 length:1200 start_codon:yes stop_codon:yes gene_type:complete